MRGSDSWPWFLVILRQLLPNLSRTCSHDGILAGIVIRRAAKDIDPKCAFFQCTGFACESQLSDMSQQRLAAVAAPGTSGYPAPVAMTPEPRPLYPSAGKASNYERQAYAT